MTKRAESIGLLFAFVFAVAIVSLALVFSRPAAGSVAVSSEYLATSTAASTAYGAFTSGRLLRSGQVTLGSVVMTGATTGIVNIYDATTTDVTQRAANLATSTILVASFPASTATGTYTFDAALRYGLYVDLASGSMPTSTITYR